MGFTSYKTKTNKTKTQHRKQRVNQELTKQRNWLHGIHKLQDEDKQNKKQHRKQRVNLVLTIQRNWIHGIHKLQDEDKQNQNTT
jgi:hypothetical protein